MEQSVENTVAVENYYTQLCVWPSATMEDSSPEDFEKFILDEFEGTRVKFKCIQLTLPDKNGHIEVPGTGGRSDLFFYVHSDDIGKFAAPRLLAGIRWWEDVVKYNGRCTLYSEEFLTQNPPTW